ncbi:unnamed protein product [Gulo gulo]|uniref:Peptidyl-prolyl cis-trans isomerase n=1 Tax=Gulo gulo TaxID=48420 RepID=A0A9X9Q716_GULGU|nr:unnamed protein product [Gulo gulo]
MAASQTPPPQNPSHRPPQSTPLCSLISTLVSEPLGRVSLELFADKVPKTAENFCALNTEEKGFGSKGSCFQRMIPGFLCQGGVFTAINGPGGKSIYGEKIGDENFILKHMAPGILSTATAGPSTTSSQIFIHTADTEGWVASVWSWVK